MAVTPSRPSRVPTTTTTSPASNWKDGPGEAITSRSRSTATMDALVRVRARVSPSRLPTNGEPAGIAICSVSRPAACCRRPASWPSMSEAPSTSASASASSSVSGIEARHASGSSTS
jgi:hypothetical protein